MASFFPFESLSFIFLEIKVSSLFICYYYYYYKKYLDENISKHHGKTNSLKNFFLQILYD